MTYQKALWDRLICDGCGVCVIEDAKVFEAAKAFGWQFENEQHMCPVCRPDSPFDAVKRVREACRATNSIRMSIDDSWLPGWDLAVEYILRALDGERDE